MLDNKCAVCANRLENRDFGMLSNPSDGGAARSAESVKTGISCHGFTLRLRFPCIFRKGQGRAACGNKSPVVIFRAGRLEISLIFARAGFLCREGDRSLFELKRP